MSLKPYKRKRDFRKTPEPAGKVKKKSSRSLIFVVQKHAASRLHYDFRLELNGVLKSWAVPKGPSLNPEEKRLAVHVEDHPFEYGDFEGTIPRGEYGGGTVLLWDRGVWIPRGDPEGGYRKGHLSFELQGKKLKGGWDLFQMHGRAGEDGKNWLLVKERDKTASASKDILRSDKSVKTKRSMEKIAKASDRVWHSKKKESASLPAFLAPQLATLVKEVPRGDSWIHEIKLDGYRAIGRIQNGKVQILTRGRQDWTRRFPEIAEALRRLPVKQALLDGEIVKLLPSGLSSFQALQNALSEDQGHGLHYFLFDLLHLDGKDLRPIPLEERRELLKKLLRNKHDPLRFSEDVEGEAREIYRQACRLGLEGVVSKLREKPYESGRSRNWLKTKCSKEQEFVIVGFTDPRRSRKGFGALLLAVHDPKGTLRYSGHVGTGFSHSSLLELHRKLLKLERKEPVLKLPASVRRQGIHWVEPRLVGEVEFTEWTQDGLARHPSFKGLREDKPAQEVVREEVRSPAEEDRPLKGVKRLSGRKNGGGAVDLKKEALEGVRLTHPDKILYPGQGITKRDLASYYVGMAERILPFIQGRPISLVRCPGGQGTKCFFQKHVMEGTPAQVKGVSLGESDPGTYAMVNDASGLAALAQMGVLEIHPWGARVDDIEHPDLMIFDLDPSPEVPWNRVVEAAKSMHELLDDLGLESFLKTTGGKGLHVVVPLARRHSWEEMKSFSKAIAQRLADENRSQYILEASKAKRKGKIFLDYLRNSRGATAVAPYSPRAREGAPVATPLFWRELTTRLKSNQFNIKNIHRRLQTLGKDPWKNMFSLKQALSRDMKAKLGLK